MSASSPTRIDLAAKVAAIQLRLGSDPYDTARFAASLPALASRRLSLELGSAAGEVSLSLVTEPAYATQIVGLVGAYWPGISPSVVDAPGFSPPVAGWRLQTKLADALPLIPANQKQQDLPTSILALLAGAESIDAVFQVVVEPMSALAWREGALNVAENLTRPEPSLLATIVSMFVDLPKQTTPTLNWLNSYQQDAYAKAASQFLFHTTIRFIAKGQPAGQLRSVAMQALRLVVGAFADGPNGLQPAQLQSAEQLTREFNARLMTSPSVLTAEELTVLWHPPRLLQEAPALRSSTSLFVRGIEIPVPKVVPSTGIAIGYDTGTGRPIALTASTLRQQTAVIGATGTGKSTAGQTIFLSACEQGLGGLLLDVKGDLALDTIGRIPRSRVDDVLFIDASDEDCQLSIDPMALARGLDRDLATDILVSSFHREFRDSWGVVIERLMRASIRALLDTDGTTLLDLPRFLRDRRFRESILSQVSDEMVRDYFSLEFEPMGSSRQLQAVSPVLNRVGVALESAVGRRLFGRPANVDLVEVKRKGKLLAARFAQGQIGERNANIAASLTLTSCLFAAMTLAAEPEASRREWVAVCDEMQNYANSSFTKAYSEGRSFGFCLVACTQFLGAIPPDVRSAILANAETLICFRLGEEDAALIGRRFEPALTRVQLTDLDNYVAAVRTSVGAERVPPFTMRVRPPAAPWRAEIADQIRANARRARQDMPREVMPRLVALPRPLSQQLAQPRQLPEIEEEDA